MLAGSCAAVSNVEDLPDLSETQAGGLASASRCTRITFEPEATRRRSIATKGSSGSPAIACFTKVCQEDATWQGCARAGPASNRALAAGRRSVASDRDIDRGRPRADRGGEVR